jgi:hypothetical protein
MTRAASSKGSFEHTRRGSLAGQRGEINDQWNLSARLVHALRRLRIYG